MTRLTKDIRYGITNAAVAHAFDPKLDVLNAEADKLGREAYAFCFPKAETKLVAAVPQNWFRQDSCLRFNAGGYNVRLSLMGPGLPVPYAPNGEGRGGYHCGILGSIPAGDLADRIQAHSHAVESYKAERQTAYRGVSAMLSGVSTLEQLREVWPEGEVFFGRFEAVAGSTLPALRVDDVNAMLGLGK